MELTNPLNMKLANTKRNRFPIFCSSRNIASPYNIIRMCLSDYFLPCYYIAKAHGDRPDHYPLVRT